MVSKIDKLVQKDLDQREKIIRNAEKKGKKQETLKKREANIKRGGLVANRQLAILAPIGFVRILATRIFDLRQYGSWPYFLLGAVGLLTLRQEQQRQGQLNRRREWQQDVEYGVTELEKKRKK